MTGTHYLKEAVKEVPERGYEWPTLRASEPILGRHNRTERQFFRQPLEVVEACREDKAPPFSVDQIMM